MSDNTKVDALIDDLLATYDPNATDSVTFRGAQYDRGLAWVHFPEGFGGLGLEARQVRPPGLPRFLRSVFKL